MEIINNIYFNKIQDEEIKQTIKSLYEDIKFLLQQYEEIMYDFSKHISGPQRSRLVKIDNQDILGEVIIIHTITEILRENNYIVINYIDNGSGFVRKIIVKKSIVQI